MKFLGSLINELLHAEGPIGSYAEVLVMTDAGPRAIRGVVTSWSVAALKDCRPHFAVIYLETTCKKEIDHAV